MQHSQITIVKGEYTIHIHTKKKEDTRQNDAVGMTRYDFVVTVSKLNCTHKTTQYIRSVFD